MAEKIRRKGNCQEALLENIWEIEREQKEHKFYNGSKWLKLWKAA